MVEEKAVRLRADDKARRNGKSGLRETDQVMSLAADERRPADVGPSERDDKLIGHGETPTHSISFNDSKSFRRPAAFNKEIRDATIRLRDLLGTGRRCRSHRNLVVGEAAVDRLSRTDCEMEVLVALISW